VTPVTAILKAERSDISLMVKKRSRKFNLRQVRASPAQPLLTLAGVTVLTTAVTPVADGEYTLVSLKMTHNVLTLTSNEGPITIGFAHSDYSDTEIKECLEQSGAISLGGKVEQEQANRLVRVIGVVSDLEPMLNNGNPVKTKLNWKMTIGDTVQLFAYNDNSSALTTGAIQNAMGSLWVRDR